MLAKPIENFLYLTKNRRLILEKLNIKTADDILRYFPSRYETFFKRKCIADLSVGEETTISGRVIKSEKEKTWRKKMPLAKIQLADGTGAIRLIWFYQPYLANTLKTDTLLTISGKVQQDKNGLYFANPVYQIGETETMPAAETRNNILPIYPETRYFSSRWIRFAILRILKELKNKEVTDPLPAEILKKFHLPSLKAAFFAIHTPKNPRSAEAARKRFAFEEIFFIQLSRLREREIFQSQPAFSLDVKENDILPLLETVEFQPTGAQLKAIKSVLEDIQKPVPMARLLEGDVGSGKTLVAMLATFAVINKGCQAAYMAPTEVLSRQHFQTLTRYFQKFKIKAGLITSSECLKFPSKINPASPTHISRSQLLKWVESGEIPMLVGTHSLIQEKVKFKNLAFAVIDEQHRFGVKQRAKLTQKGAGPAPHLLSMTATPIPRTLALTIYGDLDLTLIDEMPKGRKQVITEIVPPKRRTEAYEKIRKELRRKKQAYVVCPRIEQKDAADNNASVKLTMKAVKEEYKKLSGDIFPEYEVAMLHGRMKPKEKEMIMENFRKGKINILVATSVIEVGVNVPNATVILIEGAERFGLAQLYQLRGRVLRSSEQAYCFIFTDSSSKKTLTRLQALVKAKNGFELAEYDLAMRGPGELSGSGQWGFSDLGMEALKNIKMVEAARDEAKNILREDYKLKNYPLLKNLIAESEKIHFE